MKMGFMYMEGQNMNRYYCRTLSDDLMEISKEEFDRYMNAGCTASALNVGHFVVERSYCTQGFGEGSCPDCDCGS